MLVTLGPGGGRRDGTTLLARLLDCHERIRRFSRLACRLAEGGGDAAVRAAALDLGRYFGVALPLHVADEEESLLPRLVQLGDQEIAAALATMQREHLEQEALLGTLLVDWRAIAAAPSPAGCRATAARAGELTSGFARHLVAEEERLFPALARLTEEERAAIVGELERRRRPPG